MNTTPARTECCRSVRVILCAWPPGDTESDRPGTLGAEAGPEVEMWTRGSEPMAADLGIWCSDIDRQAGRPASGLRSVHLARPRVDRDLEGPRLPGRTPRRLRRPPGCACRDSPMRRLARRRLDPYRSGLRSLIHRDGDERPEPLTPGERCVVEVRMSSIGYSVPAGRRLWLAVSATYWLRAWPSPERVELGISAGSRFRLEVPVRTKGSEAHEPPGHFSEPEEALTPAYVVAGSGEAAIETRRDIATGCVETGTGAESHLALLDDGLDYSFRDHDRSRILDGRPLSACNSCERKVFITRGDWNARIQTLRVMSSKAETFQLTIVLEGYEADCRVLAKTWGPTVPRDLVDLV